MSYKSRYDSAVRQTGQTTPQGSTSHKAKVEQGKQAERAAEVKQIVNQNIKLEK